MRRSLVTLVVGALLAVGLAAPAGAFWRSQNDKPANLTEVVLQRSGAPGSFDRNSFDYDLLREAVLAADLADAVAGVAGGTLFAPNDRAFIRLAQDLGYDGHDEAEAFGAIATALSGLPGGLVPNLQAVLTYHVSPDNYNAFEVLLRRGPIPTLQGGEIGGRFLTLVDKDPDLRDPRVTFPLQISTGNDSVFHTIDRVLIPVDL